MWGSASNGVDITYGSDSDRRDADDTLPVELPLDGEAMWYSIMAQLQGGGDIYCSVTVEGETADAHAAGGYNICHAQLSDLTGDWE